MKLNLPITLYLFIVKSYSFIYNFLPFFIIKKYFLKLSGSKIGRNSYIHTKVKFFTIGKISVGNNTTINPGCYLDARMGIFIGNNVQIAHDTKIYTLGHDVNDPYLKSIGGPVRIEDNVFIFSNVLIMPNVTIGEGAVVYAGSVVTKNVPEYTIVAGNPARVIKERNRDIKYITNYGKWFAI